MSSIQIKVFPSHKCVILVLLLLFITESNALKAMTDSGPFAISSIATSPASSCSAADGTITLTIDAASPGTSPYDVSLDNGATWVETNLVPNGAGEISVTNQAWGTYALAVRDATSAVIFPGYAQVSGCTLDIGAYSNPSFSTSAVTDATGYDWSTTEGTITAGQNTTSATFDFSSVAHNTVVTICAQPTGPLCTAPPTCFNVRIIAIETSCSDGVDNDGDGLVDCADCVECATASNCGDNDNDGVGDFCDLDDDNDGIPDAIECFPINTARDGFITADSYDFTGGGAGGSPAVLNSITIDGTEFTNFILPDTYTSNFDEISSVPPRKIRIDENDVEISDYSTASNWNSDALAAFQDRNMNHYQQVRMALRNGVDYFQVGYDVPIFVNQNLFIAFSEREGNNSVILEAIDVNGNAAGSRVTVQVSDYKPTGAHIDPDDVELYLAILPLDDLAPVNSLIYAVRVYDNHNTSDAADGKVFVFGDPVASCVDTDNDGVEDYLDLDSDNDGIYDLDEAGHAAADVNEDGVIDGAPSTFGANGLFNGLETSAESGVINYSVADSEDTPDGIFDAYELDADGDGCFDATEESVADSDADGIAGTGTPSVNSNNGLVTSNSYTSPANNRWQNSSTSMCPSISGRVFEDINYGGGVGRTYAQANTSAQASGWTDGAIAVENARVELYSSAGAFLNATTTDAAGEFSFENLQPQNYQVRFVTRSIVSNRGSNSTSQPAYSVPTFRSVGTTSYTNEVGGADASREDAVANTTNANISTLNSANTVAQAVTLVDGTSGAEVTNVDLGVNFNVVSNINDTGIGSLRQFILNSNELDNTNLDQEDNPAGRPVLTKALGEDVSIFEIPGAGPHIIALSNVLPDVEDTHTHISGYTQQGSVQGLPETRTIAVGVNGGAGGFDGLILQANNSTVSGLALSRFVRAIEVVTSGVSDTYIWGNYVGLEPDGISVGTNTSTGIQAQNQTNVIIGTNGDGVNDLSEGNVIVDSYEGINLRACSSSLIAGNYVGIDHTGITDAGNRFYGIHLRDCIGRNVVGLDDNISTLSAAAARNVSSGNGTDGIRLSSSSNQVVAGNYFGTDRTGTVGVANGGYGVQFITAASNNQIGTDSDNARDVEERNVISGNGAGLRFVSGGTGADNWIAGNYIGVDVTGNVALPNLHNGVELTGDQSNTILGTNGDGVRDILERNIISGNRDDGIRIGGTAANLVAGNHIGVGADPTVSIPNEGRGIIITTTAANNIIGYSPSMANSNPAVVGNIIRGNGDCGIALSGTGHNNRLSRNSYGNHTNLAIDLDYDLVSINDNGDGDTGPNTMLNYPVLNYSKADATTLRIQGFAPAGSTVEFYIADAGPTPGPTLPSGYTSSFGEGYTYLASAVEGSASDSDATTGTYTNDGSGTSTVKTQQKFSFDIPIASLHTPISVGDVLTAIAIDASGNTSEFSGVMQARFIEICDDLIDNDGDGEIDCEDDDCPNVLPVATVSN